MTKNKLKPIDVSKYTVTDTGQVLKMNKEVEVIQRPTYAELEKKISILLSCKNCPDNKGGYICEKEYEGKCLSQKIQYIKELQEENKKWKDEWQEQVQKANDECYARTLQTIQLNKAKDHIKKLLGCLRQDTNDPETNYYVCKYMTEAEQFLKENK